MHVELQEHLVEVILNSLRTEEELRGDVAVAATFWLPAVRPAALAVSADLRCLGLVCAPSRRLRAVHHASVAPIAQRPFPRRCRAPYEAGFAPPDVVLRVEGTRRTPDVTARARTGARLQPRSSTLSRKQASASYTVRRSKCATTCEDTAGGGAWSLYLPKWRTVSSARRRHLWLTASHRCFYEVGSSSNCNRDLSRV